jgi:ABC-type phosphate/phosphonate transport system substrate-binding protein
MQTLLSDVRALAANQPQALPRLAPLAAPTPEILPLPEKYSDRIVLGIETKAITDFGSYHELEQGLRNLAAALQKAVGLKLEWRLLSPAELLLALHQGELDGVVAYETDLGKYQGPGRLEPVLTGRKNGRTDQPCCLLVRAGSAVTTLAQARGLRLGYSNSVIVSQMDQLFFNNQAAPSAHYFGSMEKQKNARDSLGALQMEAVDVVAEYGYILDIAKRIPEMNVRVIAKSAPVPHAPLWLRSSRFPNKNSALQKLVTTLHDIQREPAAAPLLQLFQLERLVRVHEEE